MSSTKSFEKVHVSGDQLLCENKPWIMKGFSLGNLLNTESFMTGWPGTDHQRQDITLRAWGYESSLEFWSDYRRSYFSLEDAKLMSELGANTVRLPFPFRLFYPEFPFESSGENALSVLDEIISTSAEAGLRTILDLHSVPGGQNPDSHSDDDRGVSSFWFDQSAQRRVSWLWEILAEHYKDDPRVVGYDVLNEPVVPMECPQDVLFRFYRDTLESIRKKDPDKVVWIEGNYWGTTFQGLKELSKENQVAFSFHFYPRYTVEKLGEHWSEKDVADPLSKQVHFLKEELGTPLWCGETGSRWSSDSIGSQLKMVEPVLKVFQENQVSWSLWSWKDVGAMGLFRPAADSPWNTFVTQIGWDFGEDEKKIVLLQKQIPGDPEITKYRLQGALQIAARETGLFPKLLHLTKKDRQELVQSFEIQRCSALEPVLALVRKYLIETN
ncbi:MAG: cellulase family glycosylhydrolase [Spirochaetales bacterium]|nr:cellulase family glycosylhydrolase [Spirochaetales bacterium]